MSTARWVRLSKFCELVGATPMEIHNKRRTGHLIDGIHCRIAGDGNLYVCLPAWEQWVETSSKERKSGDINGQGHRG